MEKTTAYTDSRWSGKHFLRTYEGTNGKGERIEAEFTICENPTRGSRSPACGTKTDTPTAS